MTLRVVIVEDEPAARDKLRALLDEVDWVSCVGEAHDGVCAVAAIDSLKPDIVFLDIELPEMSGLQVLERVSHNPLIIVTTAYDRYAVSAFELQAVDYLLKPFARERFGLALERARKARLDSGGAWADAQRIALALSDTRNLARIFVRDRGKITPIAVGEIERLEAEGDYVAVHARGRRHLVYLSLNEFVRRLDPIQFLRIHRAHVVNLEFVRHFEAFDASRLQVTMNDGTKVLASRVRSRELRHLVI